MKQPEEGSYASDRIVMVRFEDHRSHSEWIDDDPLEASTKAARSFVRRGRALPEMVPALVAAIDVAMRSNPRSCVARIREDASVVDQMKALGRMEPEIAKAFGDGTKATITNASTFESLKRFMASEGRDGIIWPRLENEGTLGLATLSLPPEAVGLSVALMDVLSKRHGCIVVPEVDGLAGRFHVVTWSATPKSHLLAAADATARDHPPFILSKRTGSLHPLAWAVLQATWNPNGARALKGPGPLRRRDPMTHRLRAYRDGWKAAAELNTALLRNYINDICRAAEKGVGILPDCLPGDDVLSEVLEYARRDVENMQGYREHLVALTNAGKRLSEIL